MVLVVAEGLAGQAGDAFVMRHVVAAQPVGVRLAVAARHLAAAMQREPWVEHFEWLEPLFNERLELKDGRMLVPTRPGLGLSLTEQARAWTREVAEIGLRA